MACGHVPADSPSAPSSREQASARHDALSLFRIYGQDELGPDGYPFAWNQIPFEHPFVHEVLKNFGLKDQVRMEAGHRCERCHHPYRNGEHGNGEWTPCDEECEHEGEFGLTEPSLAWTEVPLAIEADLATPMSQEHAREAAARHGLLLLAHWRILTVHHLNGVKADCRWYNLAALCQRCHLHIQGKVVMEQIYPHEHSEWFKPHAAAYYAQTYLGQYLTREETMARLDELLMLERLA